MDDLSVVLTKSFCNLYKKTQTFPTVTERVKKMNEQRKINRHDVAFEKRKIPENMTPVATPLKREKIEKTPPKVTNKRLEMLAKWKAEKEKKKQEERKKIKPLFKVTHVPLTVGLPSLETVNLEIKGKPFKSKFAPPNHKFKPPSNIEHIELQSANPPDKGKRGKGEPARHQMLTRSQSRSASSAPTSVPNKVQKSRKKSPAKTKTIETKNGGNQKIRQKKSPAKTKTNQTKNGDNQKTETEIETQRKEADAEIPVEADGCGKNDNNESILSPDFPIANEAANEEEKTPNHKIETEIKTEGKEADAEIPVEADGCGKSDNNESILSPDFPIANEAAHEEEKTPNKGEPPVYISPFVTISRGKNSARKEYEARRSKQTFPTKPDTPDYTSPKAGAAYFSWLLDNHTSRLQALCEHWGKYKTDNAPPEEAVSMIDVTIGQTNLLITKKFVQFRGLIEHCKEEDSETPVTCEDLHGFWDMMNIQVKNLDQRFENLDNLKANNWQEIVPEVKKGAVKKKGKPLSTAKASAGLREAIQAARKKKQTGSEEKQIELETVDRKTPQNRRTSRLLTVKSTDRGHRNSSPGLTMIKVGQYAKGIETPAKSILKTDVKSAKSHVKTVFFQDDVKENDQNIENDENIENDVNKSNTPFKAKTPIRRSTRLSKTKLF